jgi:hypothetical protein
MLEVDMSCHEQLFLLCVRVLADGGMLELMTRYTLKAWVRIDLMRMILNKCFHQRCSIFSKRETIREESPYGKGHMGIGPARERISRGPFLWGIFGAPAYAARSNNTISGKAWPRLTLVNPLSI